MFDDLDDPAAPAPGPAERAAVASRATRLRRRRAAALAGGGTSVALVVALVAYAASAGSPRSLDVVSETPSAEPTATATAPPEPSPTPTPTPSRSTAAPTPTPTTKPPATRPPTTPAPTPTPTEHVFPGNEPDGKPGWSNGFVWCGHPESLPPAGSAPYPELELELRIPAVLKSGGSVQATLRVTNTGTRQVGFSVWGGNAGYLLDGRGHAGAQMGNDAVMISHVELAPGAYEDLSTTVNVWQCGDTSEDPKTPLPAGSYRATALMHWDGPSAGPSPSPSGSPERRSGDWAAPVVTVRVE